MNDDDGTVMTEARARFETDGGTDFYKLFSRATARPIYLATVRLIHLATVRSIQMAPLHEEDNAGYTTSSFFSE